MPLIPVLHQLAGQTPAAAQRRGAVPKAKARAKSKAQKSGRGRSGGNRDPPQPPAAASSAEPADHADARS
eukprot:11229268-Alexandrium_andersonii.AAC.1